MRMFLKLLLFVGVVGGLFYVNYMDRVVTPEAEKETINNVFALLQKQTDDGKGLPKDAVWDVFGFKPQETRVVEGVLDDLVTDPASRTGAANQSKIDFEVETYRFERSSPFSTPPFVEVVYFNGAMFQAISNGRFVPGDRSFRSTVINQEDGFTHTH